jgi:hypothetical protein
MMPNKTVSNRLADLTRPKAHNPIPKAKTITSKPSGETIPQNNLEHQKNISSIRAKPLLFLYTETVFNQ